MKEQKPHGHWNNKQNCLDEALKYNTKLELIRGNKSLYNKLSARGWIDEATQHMKVLCRPANYWTKERCLAEALKYKHRKDFELGSKGAYGASYFGGWMEEVCSHMIISIPKWDRRIVYSYEFSDGCAYVGLTYDMENRKGRRALSDKDQVTKHIKKTGLTPKITILTEYVKTTLACELEHYYIEKYRAEGWNMLNVAKAGSIGFTRTIDKDKYLNIVNKYDDYTKFKEDHNWMLNKIIELGWDDLLVNLKFIIFNIEVSEEIYNKCYKNTKFKNKYIKNEYSKIISKYDTIDDFKIDNIGIYNTIIEKGWSKELLPKIKPLFSRYHKYRNKNIVINELEKYNSINELMKSNYSLYRMVIKNGWKDELFKKFYDIKPRPNPPNYWTKERCL